MAKPRDKPKQTQITHMHLADKLPGCLSVCLDRAEKKFRKILFCDNEKFTVLDVLVDAAAAPVSVDGNGDSNAIVGLDAGIVGVRMGRAGV